MNEGKNWKLRRTVLAMNESRVTKCLHSPGALTDEGQCFL